MAPSVLVRSGYARLVTCRPEAEVLVEQAGALMERLAGARTP
jgi:hypothetical protein